MSDVVTDPYVRDLLVSTYHFIKQNPETWAQETWRCDTGMCFAGWLITLDATSEFEMRKIENSSVWGMKDFKETENCMEYNLSTLERAKTPIGFPVEFINEEADLFDGGNTLTDIRIVLTRMLGVDPETLQPSEEFMLTGKHEAVKINVSKVLKARRVVYSVAGLPDEDEYPEVYRVYNKMLSEIGMSLDDIDL